MADMNTFRDGCCEHICWPIFYQQRICGVPQTKCEFGLGQPRNLRTKKKSDLSKTFPFWYVSTAAAFQQAVSLAIKAHSYNFHTQKKCAMAIMPMRCFMTQPSSFLKGFPNFHFLHCNLIFAKNDMTSKLKSFSCFLENVPNVRQPQKMLYEQTTTRSR